MDAIHKGHRKNTSKDIKAIMHSPYSKSSQHLQLPKVAGKDVIRSYDTVERRSPMGPISDSSGRDNLAELIAENKKIIHFIDDKKR